MPNLRDILDVKALQKIMEDFSGLADIAVAVIDLEGRVLAASNWQDICTKFHRIHPETRRNCIESDTILSSGVAPGAFKLYRCNNHLCDIVTPITAGGRHVGNLFLGQFLLADEEIRDHVFLDQARQYGFDETRYLDALARVPRWNREKVDQVMAFYAGFAQLVSELGYANMNLARSLTEREELMLALRESEEASHALLNATTDAAFMTDLTGKILTHNREIARRLGCSMGELAGRCIYDILPHEVAENRKRLAEEAANTGRPVRFEDQRNGRQIHNSIHPIADAEGNISKLAVFARDITEQRLTEANLRASANEQAWLLNSMINAFAIHQSVFDAEGRFVGYRFEYVNHAFEQITGVTLDAIQGKTVHDIWPETEPEWIETYGQVAITGKPVAFSMYHKPTARHYHGHAYRPWDTAERFCVVFEDVTEHRQTEEELRESEEKFSRAFHYSPIAMSLSTLEDARFLDVNAEFLRLIERPREAVVGHTALELGLWENPDQRRVILDQIERGGPAQNIEVNMRTGSAKRLTLMWSAEKVLINNRPCLLVSGIDITDRKRAEEEQQKLQAQLIQAQKMEAVGRLAGGVAHDFNNMLAVILGQTEMALMEMGPNAPLHKRLAQIQKTTERSADLVRQLLAFARKQTVAPKVLDLNDTLAGMLKMIRRLIGEDIDLAWMPGPSLWPVRMDPTQIDQILANLCVNARDAIQDVGRITIETENVTFDAAYANDHPGSAPGDHVLLSVSDDGCGMGKEVLENLFEPFFTTKASGKGTGLGLATVYGIVKQNNGFINVYSEIDQGTTFRIYLPRHKAKTEEGRQQAAGGPPGSGGAPSPRSGRFSPPPR